MEMSSIGPAMQHWGDDAQILAGGGQSRSRGLSSTHSHSVRDSQCIVDLNHRRLKVTQGHGVIFLDAYVVR